MSFTTQSKGFGYLCLHCSKLLTAQPTIYLRFTGQTIYRVLSMVHFLIKKIRSHKLEIGYVLYTTSNSVDFRHK